MPGLEDHLADLLAPLGGVTIRRMFGGRGVFKEGLMFALLSSRDVFYFTADEPDEFAEWARAAFAVAKRTQNAKTSPGKAKAAAKATATGRSARRT